MSGVGWTSRFERVTLYPPIPLDQKRVLFPLDRFEAAVCGPKGPDPYWEARFLAPRAGDTDVLFAPSYTLPLLYSGAAVVMNHGPAQNRVLTYARGVRAGSRTRGAVQARGAGSRLAEPSEHPRRFMGWRSRLRSPATQMP